MTSPSLRDALYAEYKSVKDQLEKSPEIDGVLFQDSLFSATTLLDSIFVASKGNVVYMDLWATWCGPCLSQFKRQGPFKNALKNEK